MHFHSPRYAEAIFDPLYFDVRQATWMPRDFARPTRRNARRDHGPTNSQFAAPRRSQRALQDSATLYVNRRGRLALRHDEVQRVARRIDKRMNLGARTSVSPPPLLRQIGWSSPSFLCAGTVLMRSTIVLSMLGYSSSAPLASISNIFSTRRLLPNADELTRLPAIAGATCR